MKNIKFIVIAVIFFAAGFLLGQSYQLPENFKLVSDQTQNQETTLKPQVTYLLKFSPVEATEFQQVDIAAPQTVLAVLEKLTTANTLELITKDYPSMGVLVEKIGDKTNGQDNKYWQYYVNGEKPQIGADRFNLSGGELVEWKFEEFISE
ncbi:MAG: DUF4430 domain-containing protein [Patescibacteria group bacterium]|jgi:hypothetical protein